MELVGTGLKCMCLTELFPFYNNVCYQCKRKEQFPKNLCDSQMQYNIFLATSFVVRGVKFGPAAALFRYQTIHSIQKRLKKWGVVLLEQTILCLHHKTYQEILHSGSAQIYTLRNVI